MFHRRRFYLSLGLASAVLACFGCGSNGTTPTPPPSNQSSDNLIVNGDAEAATGSTDGSPVKTPGWKSTGEATAYEYKAIGYPVPGPKNPGKNFFSGGPDDMTSSLTQTIDVNEYKASIDADGVTFSLSGWLGGYIDQGDSATLTVTFQGDSGASLGKGVIGPVTARDRSDETELLKRSSSGAVPAGTRSVLVVLAMRRTDGSANDGYADDLSLIFDGV